MKGLRLPAAERSDARPRKKKKKGTKMNKNENSLIIIDGTRPGHETGMGGCYRKTFVLHRDPETNELCISQRISAGEIACPRRSSHAHAREREQKKRACFFSP